MNLEALLRDQNTHWLNKNYLPPEAKWFHRQTYYREILNGLPKNLIICLTGLRRVGKSTLLKQTIAHLLKNNPPENIFYFSFDQSLIKNEGKTLREILNLYAHSIHQKPLSQLTKNIYILLDEIQTIPYWQDIVKTFHDTNPRLKFIVSGSSSLFISQKAAESLAGRLKEINIPVLSFKEYLKLNPKTAQEINKLGLKKYSRFFPDVLKTLFESYLAGGQFPQPIKETYSPKETKEYLATIEGKIIEIDLPRTFSIERPDILRIIFNYFKHSSSSLLRYENLTNDLGVDIRTTIKYIGWLQKAFLISICYNHTKKLVKASRTSKKLYLSSTNFAKNLEIGKTVETYIFNFLKNLGFSVEFFRFQNKEIDFITTTEKGEKIPWEVKYQSRITSKDEKNVIAFAGKNHSPYAFLITKNQRADKKIGKTKLMFIPACNIELIKKALLEKLH